MAISSSAMTLAQYAMLSNDPLVQAVTFSLIDNGSIMARDVPFTNKQSLFVNGVRWEGNLPTVAWANINEEGTTVSAQPTPYQESIYTSRNYIDVDKLLDMDENAITNARSAQTEIYMKAFAYDFNDKFINNTHTAGNAKAPVGIRARIDNYATYGVRSENKIDAGGVVLTASATSATFGAFLEFVDQALWSVDSPDGNGVVLYLSAEMSRRWDRLARQFSGVGGFSTATDQLGRGVTMYKNAIIRDVGKKADQSTNIITNTETAAGVDGSSTMTSIYAVNYTAGHFGGWQMQPLAAQDLGLLENGVTYRTLVDWAGGFLNQSTRSLARVYDLKYS